jgi:hypothetical protein
MIDADAQNSIDLICVKQLQQRSHSSIFPFCGVQLYKWAQFFELRSPPPRLFVTGKGCTSRFLPDKIESNVAAAR